MSVYGVMANGDKLVPIGLPHFIDIRQVHLISEHGLRLRTGLKSSYSVKYYIIYYSDH